MPPAPELDLRRLGGGVVSAFTSRHGGVSDPPYDSYNLASHVGDDPAGISENRRRLAEATGARLVWAEQVHGAGIAVAEGAAETYPGVDALVTTQRGVALCIQVADCLPVLLADPGAGVVGAAHAGRKGLLAGVLYNTLLAMSVHGADPGRMTALVGPAIGACCYELPAEMVDELAADLPAARGTTRAGTPSMDLRAGATALLTDAGIGTVTHVGGCTAEDPSLFSFRRDGVTGRQAGLIWLEA